MSRRPAPLVLTPPGGPLGWPSAALSHADACLVLGRRRPGPVYLLTVDQAARSGWSCHDTRRVVAHGVTQSTRDQVDALEQLRALPGWDWQRVLVALEDHAGIPLGNRARYDRLTGQAPTRNTATILGLGDARGRWHVLLDLRAHPKAQRLLVEPRTWRKVLRGMPGAGDDWKSAATRWASATLGKPIGDDNEAEAIAMSHWLAGEGLHDWALERLRDNAAARKEAR